MFDPCYRATIVLSVAAAALAAVQARGQEPPPATLSAEALKAEIARLRMLNAEDFKLTKDDGRRLFQTRHEDLARLAPGETPKLRELMLDVLTYPRMDGSTSTQPLASLIACRCLGAKHAWLGREQALPKKSIDPTSPRSELELFFEPEFRRSEPELELLEFTLRAHAETLAEQRLAAIINALLATNASTHEAYENLIQGASEIGLLARRPSDDETALARMKGVELEVLPCALDAFVFMVHRDNPVHNLTTAQIRDIYSGKINNWNGVGAKGSPITAFQREENSGSQELMRSLVMKATPLAKPTGRYQSAPGLIGRLMSSTFLELTYNKDGIGYSVYYYERYMSGSPRTRVIAVDGVEPTPETIANRKYPFVSEVFVVTRADLPPAAPARRLRDWLLSPEGQAVVRESGYVPLAQNRER